MALRDLVDVQPGKIAADLHQRRFKHIPVDGAVDVLHTLLVRNQLFDHCGQAFLQRMDRLVGCKKRIGLLGQNLLQKRRDILIVIVERFSVDAAVLNDHFDADVPQRVHSQQLQEACFDRLFCKSGHGSYSCSKF